VPLSIDDVILKAGRIDMAGTRTNETNHFARKCQEPALSSDETKQKGYAAETGTNCVKCVIQQREVRIGRDKYCKTPQLVKTSRRTFSFISAHWR